MSGYGTNIQTAYNNLMIVTATFIKKSLCAR